MGLSNLTGKRQKDIEASAVWFKINAIPKTIEKYELYYSTTKRDRY